MYLKIWVANIVANAEDCGFGNDLALLTHLRPPRTCATWQQQQHTSTWQPSSASPKFK